MSTWPYFVIGANIFFWVGLFSLQFNPPITINFMTALAIGLGILIAVIISIISALKIIQWYMDKRQNVSVIDRRTD